MLSNEDWWLALDRLAEAQGLTPSALARQAGLDATSFNRSKRRAPDGRPRWPSTESISKVLAAMNVSIEDFIAGAGRPRRLKLSLQSLGDISERGSFQTGDTPGGGSSVFIPSAQGAAGTFALRVGAGSVFAPAYAEGDVLVLTPEADPKPPQRIVALLSSGDVVAGTLARALPGKIEIVPFGSDGAVRFTRGAIRQMATILWCSQ